MKSRVIQIQDGKFIPQIKVWWWWEGLYKSGADDDQMITSTKDYRLFEKFDDLKDAVTLIKNYDFQRSNGGVVVWRSNG
jgi:hypothetical protein